MQQGGLADEQGDLWAPEHHGRVPLSELARGDGRGDRGPGRRVVSLQADGSAMYTMQTLWTQAREGLDVTTVIYNNRSYSILNMELQRVGGEPGGEKAVSMLDLHHPDLDFVSLASGMGVPATRAETAEQFVQQLERSFSQPGPSLIEAIVPPLL